MIQLNLLFLTKINKYITEDKYIEFPYYFYIQIWKIEWDLELFALACVDPVALFLL